MEPPYHPADDPNLEPLRAAVRKLPPYPFAVNSDSMRAGYVNGLKACETPEALREFIVRWAPLWTIRFREPHPDTNPLYAGAERSLVDGTFDRDAVFAAIADLRDAPSTPDEEEKLISRMNTSPAHQTAACVLMPGAMLEMSIVADHFGVPVNVAWIQATGLVELF